MDQQDQTLPIAAETAQRYIVNAETGTKMEIKDLKKGDRFRIFNPDNTPVDGGRILTAKADAIEIEPGHWGIQKEAEEVPAIEVEVHEVRHETEDTRSNAEKTQEVVESLGLQVMKLCTKEITRTIGANELSNIASQMAHHIQEGARLEEEKKEVTSRLKKQQDGHEGAARLLADKYKNKEDTSDRVVIIALDPRNQIRRIFDVETGVEVGQEALEPGDLQHEMKLEDAKAASKPKPATKKPEAPAGPLGIEHRPEKASKVGVGDIAEDGEYTPVDVVNEALEGMIFEAQPASKIEFTISIQVMRPISEHGSAIGADIIDSSGRTFQVRGDIVDQLDQLTNDGQEHYYLKIEAVATDRENVFSATRIESSDYTPDDPSIDDTALAPAPGQTGLGNIEEGEDID